METANTHQHDSGNVNGRLDLDTAHPQPKTENEDERQDGITSPSSITSPPYWIQSHHRSLSSISAESVAPRGITLQDNTDGSRGDDSKNDACWAKSVYIEDFLIINESRTNIGAFVVWTITVETLEVGCLLFLGLGLGMSLGSG